MERDLLTGLFLRKERRKRLHRGKRMIGLFLLVISILGLSVWEQWGKEQLKYDHVLVLKENVEKGTVITASMLESKKMDVGEACILPDDTEQVVGRQAAAFIHKGVPLFYEYFQQGNLSPDEKQGRYVLAIPEEWILSRPQTLSRGDKVFFFCEGTYVTAAFVSAIDGNGVIEVIVDKAQTSKLAGLVSKGEKLVLTYQ